MLASGELRYTTHCRATEAEFLYGSEKRVAVNWKRSIAAEGLQKLRHKLQQKPRCDLCKDWHC